MVLHPEASQVKQYNVVSEQVGQHDTSASAGQKVSYSIRRPSTNRDNGPAELLLALERQARK